MPVFTKFSFHLPKNFCAGYFPEKGQAQEGKEKSKSGLIAVPEYQFPSGFQQGFEAFSG